MVGVTRRQRLVDAHLALVREHREQRDEWDHEHGHDRPGPGDIADTITAVSSHARQLDASKLQILISATVFLKGFDRAVRRVDVKFHPESKLRPVDIELVPGRAEVRCKRRQLHPLGQRNEFPLELRTGETGRLVDGECTRERRGASMPLVAREDRAKVGEIEDVQLFGTTDEAAQAAEADPRRKVERGARYGRNRDPLLQAPITISESFRAVDADGVSSLTGNRSRHMDWNRSSRHQPEQPASRIVAQQRTGPRRQHRG